MSFYRNVRATAGAVVQLLYRFEAINEVNIPTTGGVLVCANHLSLLDPIGLAVTTKKRHYHFMAKEELFRNKWFGKFLRKLNAFPVKRGASDREALRNGLKVIKEGHVLGLFPEGTRSKTGEIGEAHGGAGFFALRTDCQVVPVAIIPPYKLFGKVKIVYGTPIDFSEHRQNKISAEAATEIIMTEIRRLVETYKK